MTHTKFNIITILPAGSKLKDGTVLTEQTKFSSDEFEKNPLMLPADHPVNQFLLRISIDRWRANWQRKQKQKFTFG